MAHMDDGYYVLLWDEKRLDFSIANFFHNDGSESDEVMSHDFALDAATALYEWHAVPTRVVERRGNEERLVVENG